MALIPAPPASINVPASSYGPAIAVSWVASANATNYVLEQSVNGGGWGVVHSGDVTSYTVTVSSSGNYAFQVSACGAGGCSAFTASGNVAVTLPPASAPSLSGPSSSATGTFTLNWTSVSGATRYQLNQNLNGTVTTPYNAGGTAWTSNALGNGSYGYQVFACNAAGCGPGSNGTAVGVLLAPAAPASVTAPAFTQPNRGFTVSWTAVTGATSYKLQQTDTTTHTTVIVSDGPGTSTFMAIANAGSYQFAAQACSNAGCSGFTNAPNPTRVIAPVTTPAQQPAPSAGGSP